ncbi:hypothetical protein RB195_001199 [Necator americanus]|uniref:Uncharacterized protein n=1 Tax=Necator americanus TaxID=51031 RepID=A0ABR1DER0_NECAM
MKLLWCVFIEEPHTRICSVRIPNRPLAAVCAFLQLSVALASLFQERYLAYDIIIFDFGLMHRVLGTEECVANYLDGGYMRFGWCIEQTSALSIAIISLICMPKPLWLLWPGLSVLTMATAPKLLEALGGRVDLNLALMFSAYIFGFCFNWIFTFILWHHYWHLERRYAPPKIKRGRSFKAPNVANV